MSETIKLDKSTGLPELPEGMFWRVYKLYNDSHYFRVGIFKRTWSGRVKLAHKDAWASEFESRISEDTILETACYVMDEWKRRENSETLFGAYPPKKLGK